MLGNRAIFGRKGLGGPPAVAEVLAALSPPAAQDPGLRSAARRKSAKPRKPRSAGKSQPKVRPSDDL